MKGLRAFLLILLICIAWISCEHVPMRGETDQKILDDLLNPERYDRRVRPAGIETKGEYPVIVNVSIYVLSIQQEDPYLKDFKLQCYLRQSWFDKRLIIPDTSSEKVKLRDPERLWTPDLFIVNEVSSHFHSVTVPNRFIFVHRDGKVLMSFRISAVINCKTNLKLYPHDQQYCRIQIESYGLQASELVLKWDVFPRISSFDKNMTDDNYALVDFLTGTETIQLSLKPDKDKVDEYSRLYLDLLFSRQFSPFLWNLYLPYIFLVILSWGSFCLPQKCLIPRLAFLTFILVLMLHLSPDFHDFRKDVRQVTALDFWFFGCLTFLTGAFLEYIYICSLVSKSTEEFSKPGENDIEDGSMIRKEKKETGGKTTKEGFMSSNYWKGCATDSELMDKACRNILFPLTFLIFNIIYWSVCYSGHCSSLEQWYDE